MGLFRWLLIVLIAGLAVIIWVNPDLLIRLIDPTAERSKAWLDERARKSIEAGTQEQTNTTPTSATGGSMLPGPVIPEIIMVDAPERANSLRETGFVAHHSGKPDLPEFSSVTPAGATDFSRNIQTIIGGSATDIATVPWLVGVRVHTEVVHNGFLSIATELCGGAIYGDRWIITAAHCVDGDFNEIEVIAGVADLDSTLAVRREARRSFVHAGYERNVLREDLAVIELSDPLPRYFPVGPWPSLDQASQISQVRQVTGYGFGLTENETVGDRLRQVQLDVVETNLRVIRVGDTAGNIQGLCQGDSGTPVIAQIDKIAAIIGMVSFTEVVPGAPNCATPGFIAGLVSLEGYMDDLRSLVNLCTAQPTKCDG